MEKIEDINKQLSDLYGKDIFDSMPIWRVVWSDDQFEKRLGDFEDITPAGVYLRTVREVRLVPKYRQWIQHKYILERYILVPEQNQEELAGLTKSYEVIWVFEDKAGNPLPPKLEACKFIVSNIYAVQYGHKMVRYVDPENSQEAQIQLKKERVEEIQNALFGDELGQIGLDLLTGQAISVPSNYKKEN